MKLKKICLINPPTTREQDEIFFPMGLVVLGTLLKSEGIPVEIVDFDLLVRYLPHLRKDSDVFEERALKLLEATHAEVFGIGSICSNFPTALSLASAIRRRWPEAKIILGGPQPSAMPQKTLECFSDLDVIVIGEGERTLLELLKADWNPEAWEKIPGLCFRSGGEVHLSPPRALIENLDEFPLPDFSLVRMTEYFPYARGMAFIEAGRGCPFRCSFCSTAEFWSRKYRAKSPKRILDEMRALKRDFKRTHFPLTHDNFTTSPKYIREFCKYFIGHNHEGFTWSSSSRTDTLDHQDLENLFKAGCRSLYFGVDTGSERVQKAIDKNLDLDDFKKVLVDTLDQGIGAVASFVIGFPDETEAELDETILLGLWAKSHGAGLIQFHRLSPLGSTKIYEDNKDHLTFNGESSSDTSTAVVANPKMIPTMQAHPDLFSSFFRVPTPHLDAVHLTCFANFFIVLVNLASDELQRLFQEDGVRPSELFREWLELHRSSPQEELFDPNFILSSFKELLSENHPKIKINSSTHAYESPI